jgi:hypothetical protein
MRKLIWIGIAAVTLPFVVMALEYLWALISGATGERFASAGIWGTMLGYYLIPVGVVLLVIGILGWLVRR